MELAHVERNASGFAVHISGMYGTKPQPADQPDSNRQQAQEKRRQPSTLQPERISTSQSKRQRQQNFLEGKTRGWILIVALEVFSPSTR